MERIKVIAQGPGIGDALWLTALARNFKEQKNLGEVIAVTSHPEIFYNSKDCSGISFSDECSTPSEKTVHLSFDFKTHAIDGYCHQLGLKPPFIRRNFIYLMVEEIEQARSKIHPSLRVIAIQSQAGPWTRNKDWDFLRFEEVVEHFRDKRFKFVQIGGRGDIRIEGCHDFFGTVRETAAIMSLCELFLGPISAGMHLASAVGIPAVIIFGGREDPRCIALDGHSTVTADVECAPCWRVEPCQKGKICMNKITSNMVIDIMEKEFSKAL